MGYQKVSEVLTQITGTEVVSQSGVQSYLTCKAAIVSAQWVAGRNESVTSIAVTPDIAIYDADATEVIVMMDDVGVKAQKPHKNIDRADGDAKRLDTTVVLIEKADKKGYQYATSGMDKAGKTTYTIEHAILDTVSQLHNVAEALPIVAITDGARSIRCTLQAIFGVAVCIILDWYHLQLKVKNLMSMIAVNKADKLLIIKELNALLWVGNVTQALQYLDAMTEVRNKAKHQELRDYLAKHEKEIINYGLRKTAGKTIGSGRCEKANDLVVAHRQKKKGMAWSKVGSSALAIVKINRINLQQAA